MAAPSGSAGPRATAAGLGLLDIETRLAPTKILRAVVGTALGAPMRGYEMHMGETTGAGTERPFAAIDGRGEGAVSADGRIMGSYIHGALASAAVRRALLARLGATGGGQDYDATVDAALDNIAADIEHHVAVDALINVARRERTP